VPKELLPCLLKVHHGKASKTAFGKDVLTSLQDFMCFIIVYSNGRKGQPDKLYDLSISRSSEIVVPWSFL